MLQTTEETELTMPSDFRWHSFLVSAGYLPDTNNDISIKNGTDVNSIMRDISEIEEIIKKGPVMA